MDNFLSQIRRSSVRKAMLVVTGLLYVSYLGTSLYCHCFQETASHHDQQHMYAEAHPQDHEGHEHSDDQSPKPHFCDCIGMENTVLVSSPVPELVGHNSIEPLISESFSVIAFLPPPSFHLLSFNHHGPPQQVPICIKNQVFLI